MKTVLGLSATSAGVGWVLIDERAGYPDTDAAVLDDDAFEVDADDVLAERCAAAARGARGIAASSGDDIGAIGLICSDDVGVHAEAIVAALKSAGFDDVRTVPREFLDDGDAGELEATALAAAQAVATDAVPAARVRCLLPPCRHRSTALRIAGTAAAAAVVALSAVGSTFIAGETEPEDQALTAGGPIQIVTAAVPHIPQPDTVRTVTKPVRQSTSKASSTASGSVTQRASEPQVLFARPQPQPAAVQPVQQAAPEVTPALGVQHLQNPVGAPEFAPPMPHLPEGMPAGAMPVPGVLPGPVNAPETPEIQPDSQVIIPQAAEALPGPAEASAPPAEAPLPGLVLAPRPVSLNPLVSGLP
ncbi:hypothetical protein [Mycolicibacterium smegmatis]|uniref:DUF7159 domain-containing protein n=1 Tax=Mycolicibacterium smegmatis (strain ATCC 700084 / mc(2)155) TaxID=246196 RepID=I7FMX9_MYCS2|nr:hypothetical protein [Mycolicibacterium smegmatis]AFP40078.1 hypothetical protein MSMEI_3615 [Mycolicibacterium smegmatis MC2 155]AIU08830.1 hypothetical protein LJ00_18400 [Mycolicibacterium smegmatis MC2 155]AIU15455.1 hypothetical protein LI99_18405 [Mycolicibacterium smegmatis]AIU22078.1 hypothetical protein LI98_18410 [Mycolicibacterium smegmatis]MCC3338781.1 hypothetical protein [Mycolicibacterium smegmatis]